MVSPITGPFYRTTGTVGTPYYDRAVWSRQKLPYDRPLGYTLQRGISYGGTNPDDGLTFSEWATHNLSSSSAYAQAYARLVDGLGDNAGLGITLAQWRQADEMVRGRLVQLASFTSAILRRSPTGVAAALGISMKDVRRIFKTRYGVGKKLSDLWLEFHFGWQPAVKDIYTGIEVFDNFIPWATLQGSGRARLHINIEPPGPWSWGATYDVDQRCRLGMNIRLVNPNVRLMQQFGILNPAAVIWDAIPWSFVVGWFTNVDQWLSSFTDFAGYEIVSGYVTNKAVATGSSRWSNYPTWGGKGVGIAVSRGLFTNPPRPVLQLKPELRIKPIRGLTAISLLTQQLAKIH